MGGARDNSPAKFPESNDFGFDRDQYHLDGSVLTVSGDVRTVFGEQFDIWTEDLLAQNDERVTLKLVDMGALDTVRLARLMRLAKRAADCGKKLHIEMPERAGLFTKRAGQA